jgi:hypothetical protein
MDPAPSAGLEPAISRLEVCGSIQSSNEGMSMPTRNWTCTAGFGDQPTTNVFSAHDGQGGIRTRTPCDTSS